MIRTAQPESLQSRVREAVKGAGDMTVKQCRKVLGMEGYHAWARISGAMKDLARSGYIKKVLPATYQWVGEPTDLAYREHQLKMARYMAIRTKKNEPFSAHDVSRVTECSYDWSKRYITALKDKGLLACAGRVKGKTAPIPVYLATEAAMRVNPEDWPGIRRQQGTKIVDEVREEVRNLAASIFCDTRGEFDREDVVRKAHLILEKLGR